MSASIEKILERLVAAREANAQRGEAERRRALAQAIDSELAGRDPEDVARVLAELRERVVARAREGEAERERLARQALVLEQRAKEADAERSRADTEREALRRQVQERDAELQTLRQQLAELPEVRRQLAELGNVRQQLAEARGDADQRLRSLELQLADRALEITNLRHQLDAAHAGAAQRQVLETQLANRANELEVTRGQLDAARGEIARLQAAGPAAGSLGALRQQLAAAEAELARLRVGAAAPAAPPPAAAPGGRIEALRTQLRLLIEDAPRPGAAPPPLPADERPLEALARLLLLFTLRSATTVDDIRMELFRGSTLVMGLMRRQLQQRFTDCLDGKPGAIAALDEKLNETLLFPMSLERAYADAIPAGVAACLEGLDPAAIRQHSTRLGGVMTDWEKAFKALAAQIEELKSRDRDELFDLHFRELVIENMKRRPT
ncbi:MAG: hypothetical protein KBD01_11870 [Acidobacteria bacterium]|nr:hypothetical protein [Acidobacteriota bacterium]